MGVTGHERRFYSDVSSAARSLQRIADALDRPAPDPKPVPLGEGTFVTDADVADGEKLNAAIDRLTRWLKAARDAQLAGPVLIKTADDENVPLNLGDLAIVLTGLGVDL